MSVHASKNLWRPLAIFAAITFAYATVLAKLGYHWWTDENYSHGLLIPFVIIYILWSQRDRIKREALPSSPLLGGIVIVLALMALFAGTAGAELFIQRISLVLVLAGTVVYFWGSSLLRLMLVPFALLLLAIPIPAIIFNQIAFPLQLFASRCAVWSMRLFDIPVLRQGNVIELMPLNAFETKKLEVVEACSGIRSLMTLLTLAVVFAYFTHPRPGGPKGPKGSGRYRWLRSYAFWKSVTIVLSAIPIAIVTNALRVSGTGVLAHYYGTQVADGFFHSFSGWVIYIVAFLLLFAVGWGVDRFRPSSAGSTTATDSDSEEQSTPVANAPALQTEGTE